MVREVHRLHCRVDGAHAAATEVGGDPKTCRGAQILLATFSGALM